MRRMDVTPKNQQWSIDDAEKRNVDLYKNLCTVENTNKKKEHEWGQH